MGIDYKTLHLRLSMGWPIEQVLETKVGQWKPQKKLIKLFGVALPLQTWSIYLNITHQALYKAAKTHNRTLAQELERRFRDYPYGLPDAIRERFNKLEKIAEKERRKRLKEENIMRAAAVEQAFEEERIKRKLAGDPRDPKDDVEFQLNMLLNI